MNKIFAFTLSEVLITVGIIGIVATLTIPTLGNDYRKRTQAIKIRKVVNDIENQLDILLTEEGKPNIESSSIRTTENNQGINNFFSQHFRINKTCQANDRECFATSAYKSIDGKSSDLFTCQGTSYLLSNSVSICANKFEKSNIKVETGKIGQILSIDAYQKPEGHNIEIFIDTNGPAKPNIGGRDMFKTYIRPDAKIHENPQLQSKYCITTKEIENGQLVPKEVCIDITDETNIIKGNIKCEEEPFGAGCLKKLMDENWQMKY